MSDVTPAAGYTSAGTLRTLAVRIHDDLRAQLDVIAQLNDRSVTEEIRVALESWVETTKSDPKTLQRTELVRAEIEREAETKRNAITAIFGATSNGGPAKAASSKLKQAEA